MEIVGYSLQEKRCREAKRRLGKGPVIHDLTIEYGVARTAYAYGLERISARETSAGAP
jgi:hypothetical protein